VQDVLVSSYNVDADKAELLTQLCHGRLGWALSALADGDVLEQRSQRIEGLASLLTAGIEQRFAYAQELAGQFSQDRKAGAEIMEIWVDWWRDLMLIKGGCQGAISNVDFKTVLEEQSKGLSLSEMKEFLTNLGLLQDAISKNVNSRLALEWLMLNLPRSESRKHVIRRVKKAVS